MGKSRKPKPLPEAREIDLPPQDYQPKKAEQEEEIDMPGADVETVRSAFFRPVHQRQEEVTRYRRPMPEDKPDD